MLFNNLKIGQELSLVREKENQYDKFAIAVYYNKYRLGYIAAYENIVLANLLDTEVALTTALTHIEKNLNNIKSSLTYYLIYKPQLIIVFVIIFPNIEFYCIFA